MPTLTFLNETYSCAKAQKGKDFVRLLDENCNVLFFAEGISDFSSYVLSDGDWEAPVSPTVGAYATLEGSVVNLTLPGTVKAETGLLVNFTAPCDCSSVNALKIGDDEYTVVDSLGNCVTGGTGTWASGSQVSIVLNAENKKAYLQNISGYNREETLTAETKALFGMGPSAVPDNVLAWLGKYNQHWWKRTVITSLFGYKEVQTLSAGNLGISGYSYDTIEIDLSYANTVLIDQTDGTVTLVDPQSMVLSNSYVDENIATLKTQMTTLLGKYLLFKNNVYFIPQTAESKVIAVNDEGVRYASISMIGGTFYTVTSQIYSCEKGAVDMVYSADRKAYPDNGSDEIYKYEYLGVPFENAVTAQKAEIGTYVGVGTYGSESPNTIQTKFKPQWFLVMPESTSFQTIVTAIRGVTSTGPYDATGGGTETYRITWDENSVSWYCTASAAAQLNKSADVYHYIVVGV